MSRYGHLSDLQANQLGKTLKSRGFRLSDFAWGTRDGEVGRVAGFN
jgi:hypothetical protein